jgi:hypothetical protein
MDTGYPKLHTELDTLYPLGSGRDRDRPMLADVIDVIPSTCRACKTEPIWANPRLYPRDHVTKTRPVLFRSLAILVGIGASALEARGQPLRSVLVTAPDA